ncbi:AAA family ATPase [Chitinimonas arctica]|uniref:AAA family ATPase n=1 Tax=Chitinimonas arctica TaxID=2594795 RepID=A0A516SFI0_9NEIS|nr:AAA family ATPase [Chitinimonas arctica]QDQ26860.1 AAA family ATPase [Chitinimonas arctica]
MKRFRAGLVVGKFAPLHRGHEWLIDRAQAQCDQLYLLSYSKPELPGCEPARRQRWLVERFPAAISLVVTEALVEQWRVEGRAIGSLPSNTAPAEEHRQFVARLCLSIWAVSVEAVFTSEDYGDGFAAHLSREFGSLVTHVELDRARANIPISATRIRGDVHGHRDYLAASVYADFVSRICLLGGESSGKSTLAIALAKALHCRYVPEYGRERWEAQGGELGYGDLLAIACEQVRREDALAGQTNTYLVCDTSPLTTLFYCQHLFGRAEPALREMADRTYQQVLLCAPDFPFVQDGTRQGADFRDLQHSWYGRALEQRAQPYHLLTGSVASRVEQVLELLGIR